MYADERSAWIAYLAATKAEVDRVLVEVTAARKRLAELLPGRSLAAQTEVVSSCD